MVTMCPDVSNLLSPRADIWNSVWQIAQRDYHFGKGRHRSLTKATYDAIGDHFRSLWGKEAGWAHSVLFTADLRAFSAKVIVKPEISEEAKAIEEIRGNLKLEVDDFKVDQKGMDGENQVYTKDETPPERGLKRVMADGDKATPAAEQLYSRTKIKRRRAG